MAYDFSHKRGDTFTGANFEILLNDVALNLVGASILLQLRKNASDADAALELETTITDGAAGLFAIDEVIIDLIPRVYVYDIQITLSTGRVITPVSGTFTILNDVTR